MRRTLGAVLAGTVLVLAGCGTGAVDQEVMENTAKGACEDAVKSGGYSGDFQFDVKENETGWLIRVTVATPDGGHVFVCDAVRDGDDVHATANQLS